MTLANSLTNDQLASSTARWKHKHAYLARLSAHGKSTQNKTTSIRASGICTFWSVPFDSSRSPLPGSFPLFALTNLAMIDIKRSIKYSHKIAKTPVCHQNMFVDTGCVRNEGIPGYYICRIEKGTRIIPKSSCFRAKLKLACLAWPIALKVNRRWPAKRAFEGRFSL